MSHPECLAPTGRLQHAQSEVGFQRPPPGGGTLPLPPTPLPFLLRGHVVLGGSISSRGNWHRFFIQLCKLSSQAHHLPGHCDTARSASGPTWALPGLGGMGALQVVWAHPDERDFSGWFLMSPETSTGGATCSDREMQFCILSLCVFSDSHS